MANFSNLNDDNCYLISRAIPPPPLTTVIYESKDCFDSLLETSEISFNYCIYPDVTNASYYLLFRDIVSYKVEFKLKVKPGQRFEANQVTTLCRCVGRPLSCHC